MIFSKKLSYRALYLILLLALLVAGAGASVRAMAQSTDSTAQPSAEPQPKAKSPTFFKEEHKAEKKSEAEEHQEYRHSASVQWLAKAFHIDVETAATGFEYFNFAVILLGIGIPLFKMVPAAMRKRTAKLNFELEVAKAKTQDANDRLKAVEEKLAGLDAEIAAIRKQVEEEMVADEVRSKNLIEEERARIIASAEQEIAAAAAQAQRGLKQFAANLAIDRALTRLTIDADTDRALFAEFAHDVAAHGKRHRAKGEQN